MVRLVMRWEVVYGHYADVVASVEACNVVCRDRGWAEWTAWAPFSGKGNEIVLTCDYPDLAATLAERDTLFADAEFMKAWRQCAQYAVQGSIWSEVLEPAPQLA